MLIVRPNEESCLMYPIRYHLIRKLGFDQIHQSGNPVYLTVYPAGSYAYYPNPKEKQFYSEDKERLLIFESTGYKPLLNPFYLQGLHAAIKWYGRTQLNMPDIRIRLTDPRRKGQDKLKD